MSRTYQKPEYRDLSRIERRKKLLCDMRESVRQLTVSVTDLAAKLDNRNTVHLSK